MERKILKIAIIAVLLVCVCSTLVSALSFTATMTPSKKVVPASTEFTVEIKVSNLDVGANGINSLSGNIKYDKNVFETITESSIEGRNGWSHSFYSDNDGKITLTKTSFVKTEEEVFQITFITKSAEDLGTENVKGLIQFTGITASNSASDITANDISVEIKIGEEDTTEGGTAENETLQINPTPTPNTNTNTNSNTNTNTNTNKAPSIGLSTNKSTNNTNTNAAANTNKNTNKNTNTNVNKAAPYVSSTNTTDESIPHTGVEDTIMYLMFAVIAVAIVFYIKFERINKEMK